MTRLSVFLVSFLVLFGCCEAKNKVKGAAKTPKYAGKTYVVRGGNNRHRFMLRVTSGPFRRDLHRVKVTRRKIEGEDHELHWIDGKPEWNPNGSKNWHGTDGGFPWSEFYSVEVWVDGKKWSFPRRLWHDCYDGSFKHSRIYLSADGKRLQITMSASDGAGHYWVIWHLTKDGHGSRQFPNWY